MAHSAEDYLLSLQQLIPEGQAWPRETDAVLTRLLAGMAEEPARVEARSEALVEEADPRETVELLPDWERVAGLPDECTAAAETIGQRQQALVARLTARGGQSPRYFIDLAAALGFEIEIVERRPFRSGFSHSGDPLGGDGWMFVWEVHLAEITQRFFLSGQGHAGEPLSTWGNAILECLFEKLKPAHTILRFVQIGRFGRLVFNDVGHSHHIATIGA